MESGSPRDQGGGRSGRQPPTHITWSDDQSGTVRDSGYRTESPSPHPSTLQFFIGNGTEDTAAGDDQPIFDMDDIETTERSDWQPETAADEDGAAAGDLSSRPTNLPEIICNSPPHDPNHPGFYESCFTPPRAYHFDHSQISSVSTPLMSVVSSEPLTGTYMDSLHSGGKRNASTQVPACSPTAVMLGSACHHQQNVIMRNQGASGHRRRRFFSEAMYSEEGQDKEPMRSRSMSAPVILTPEQRYCATELRRISDDFDREYHGFGSLYKPEKPVTSSSSPAHSSSFPETQHNAGWWKSVVQYVAPHRNKRRQPSPIVEHAESTDSEHP